MKTLMTKILPALCLSGLLLSASAQPAPGDNPDNNAPPPPPDQMEPPPNPGDQPPPDESVANSANEPAAAAPVAANSRAAAARPAAVAATNVAPAIIPTVVQDSGPLPATATSTNMDELRLNFYNAPLDMVLKYLSDAAGFIIVMDTQVRGNVSVISSHPMTRNEAVDLLNSVLNKNGYAAIRAGRTLTIVDKNDAKTRNIPVITGNDPNAIPNNDEIVTQIIPIRYVEAKQLVSDLSSFVSPQATIVANDSGNSIVITDTQSNIRHFVEIIEAIDSSAQGETEIRVFPLKYANPNDVASELGQIFPSSGTGTGQTQSPIRFGGGGGPGGFFARMMAANAANSGQNSRVQKQSQVVAVADPRTSSVIVTASKDLMTEIAGMMAQLDLPSARDQKVFVYHMNNGDPQQALTVLQSMFQSSSTSRTGTSGGTGASSQNSALQNREIQNATTIGNTTTGTGTGFGTGTGTTRGAGAGGSLF